MALIPFLQSLGLPYGWAWSLSYAVFILIICLVLMLAVAAVILADRKIWAAVQMRRGPNVVGPFGLLQTIADALKFLLKEVIIPAGANKVLFFIAPLISVMLAFIAWAVIPFNHGWVISDINVGILYLFAVSSLSVYGVVVAGWASNSNHALLSALLRRGPDGVLRSLDRLCDDHGTVVRRLAEPVENRGGAGDHGRVGLRPLELLLDAVPDAGNFLRLVLGRDPAPALRPAGSGIRTGGRLLCGILIRPLPAFLPGRVHERDHASYALMSILFLGGWLSPINIWPLNIPALGIIWLLLKLAFLFFMMAMVKAMVPRYRYDQLMRLGWKVFLPTSLLWVVLTAAWVMSPYHNHLF